MHVFTVDEFIRDHVKINIFQSDSRCMDAVKKFFLKQLKLIQGCLHGVQAYSYIALFNYIPQGKDMFATESPLLKAACFFFISVVFRRSVDCQSSTETGVLLSFLFAASCSAAPCSTMLFHLFVLLYIFHHFLKL